LQTLEAAPAAFLFCMMFEMKRIVRSQERLDGMIKLVKTPVQEVDKYCQILYFITTQ
jgi:hypothetical protein